MQRIDGLMDREWADRLALALSCFVGGCVLSWVWLRCGGHPARWFAAPVADWRSTDKFVLSAQTPD
jgi:hypothetical protein